VADVVEISMLFDFYGTLLTENQQRCMELYYNNDMSFAEIADELGISRQGVYDSIKRGRNLLESYEEKLGLVARFFRTKESLEKVNCELDALCNAEDITVKSELVKVKEKIEGIVGGL
jgi:predicted DNA-binding protein YlxM (UPF0122 family)